MHIIYIICIHIYIYIFAKYDCPRRSGGSSDQIRLVSGWPGGAIVAEAGTNSYASRLVGNN